MFSRTLFSNTCTVSALLSLPVVNSRIVTMATVSSSEQRKREKKIIDALSTTSHAGSGGLNTDDLVQATSLSMQAVVDTINVLLQEHKIVLLQGRGGQAMYRLEDPETERKFKGMSTDDFLVYQTIEARQNKGIWTKDIKGATNIHGPALTRILKELEKRGLVKSVKSVTNANKKVYMLAELEPDKDISGGAWYSDNVFDSELVEVLRSTVLQYVIQRRAPPTLIDITNHINGSGVCVLKLSPADINSIVQTLLHDDQILECDDMGDDGETKYIKADWEYMVQDVGLATIPCGVCPVASQCGEGKVVSPETCPYWRAYINRL